MQAGKAPFANVNVNVNVIVYYWPFNPPARFAPPVVAIARTSARGKFSVRLNTSRVQRTGLADVGSGPGGVQPGVPVQRMTGRKVAVCTADDCRATDG